MNNTMAVSWREQLVDDIKSDTRKLETIKHSLRMNRERLRHLDALTMVAKPGSPKLISEMVRIMGVEPMHVSVLSQKLVDANIRPDLDRSPNVLTSRMHTSPRFKRVGVGTYAVV